MRSQHRAAGGNPPAGGPGRFLTTRDRGAAARALANLLANAVRYSGGAKTVQVSGERGATHVLLVVCDRGPGIPPG